MSYNVSYNVTPRRDSDNDAHVSILLNAPCAKNGVSVCLTRRAVRQTHVLWEALHAASVDLCPLLTQPRGVLFDNVDVHIHCDRRIDDTRSTMMDQALRTLQKW